MISTLLPWGQDGKMWRTRPLQDRYDVEARPAFELYVERPCGEYVWMCVMDAGREFGITPVGWGAWAAGD